MNLAETIRQTPISGTGHPAAESGPRHTRCGEAEVLHADVVVIGAGPAGMAAAATASGAGASVLVLECGSRTGGNAVRSNGYLAFVDDDADAREAFVADARAAFRTASQRYSLVWDEAAVRQFANQSATTYRILTNRGVRFGRRVARPEHSADRIRAVVDPAMFGRAYEADFARPGIRTESGVRAERLVVEAGRVVGVNAHRRASGIPLQVGVSRSVVIATGGFQAGHKLRERYQSPVEAQSPYYGTADCRGDGHLMGESVGGHLVNMNYLPPTVLAASTVAENAIAVNCDGVRFHDETGSFAGRVAALRAQTDRRAWFVLAEDAARSHAYLIEQMPQPPVRAGSVAELARAIGVPADGLTATVRQWNDFLASSATIDPQFGRTALPQDRRTLGSALVAVPMVEGVNFSCGGFRTTPRMQVVDGVGTAIPGLYAAGDTTAGLNAAAGMVGLHISGAFTQGRIAGKSAAEEEVNSYAAWRCAAC